MESAVAKLQVNRRGLFKERTLLSSINTVQVTSPAMEMAKGDQQLYGNRSGSRYSMNELAAAQAPAAKKKGKEKGNPDID